MNNLYGWAMNDYLPYEGFEWLNNVDEFDVMSISECSSIGSFIKVDLDVLMNYINYTMIIHLFQKNLLFLLTCCQNIVENLLINIR